MNPYGDQLSDVSQLSTDRDLPSFTREAYSQLKPDDGTASSGSIWAARQPSEIVLEQNDAVDSQSDSVSPPSDLVTEETVTESDDLSFLLCEDSIALSDTHFEPFPEPAVVSSSFNRSRQLLCNDSLDGHSHGSATPIFYDCQDGVADDEDFLLTTAEETSLDSGLGSVESAYVNSEEESVLSPDPVQTSSQVVRTVVTTVETVDRETEIYYDCSPKPECSCILKKRKHESEATKEDQPELKKRKTKKKVNFQNVTVFYFPRKQGFVSVPSQGGSTLGMAMRHAEAATMTMQEHNFDIAQRHSEKVREHRREQKIKNKIKQLQFINPELDNSTLSTMAQSAVSQVYTGPSASHEVNEPLEQLDPFFFLQPISTKKRRKLLRLAGVERIDGEEKLMNRVLRESRELCGCTCEQVCVPDTCECALAGIQCQVDRESFPCGCLASGCQNENGRIEFDVDRVQIHFLETLERLRREEDSQLELVDSSESDCDVVSSDDTQQLAAVETNPGQQDGSNFVEGTGCSRDCDSADFAEDCPVTACIERCGDVEMPQDFLDTLGLERVEIQCKSNEQEIAQIVETVVARMRSLPSSTDVLTSQDLIPGDFSYGEYSYPHFCHRKSTESLVPSIPDPPHQSLSHQMYGSTSYCQGTSSADNQAVTVSLEPIASFMAESCNASAKESVTCSTSF